MDATLERETKFRRVTRNLVNDEVVAMHSIADMWHDMDIVGVDDDVELSCDEFKQLHSMILNTLFR